MKQSIWISVFFAVLLVFSTGFASHIGQMQVFDPARGSQTVTYEKIDGFAITEGDIIIARLNAELHPPKAIILPKIGGNRWPNGIVPFELAEDLPLASKLYILEAIVHIQQKTNLEFIELTSKNRTLYLDYLSFVPTVGTTCSSYVGKHTGRQEINLAPRCNTMNIVHEICHAIGLWHEQSRADRDQYIRIVWENIDEDHKYNFEQHLSDGEDYGEYDYQSIMHYPSYAFSKNGGKTIIPLQENTSIGQREHLSDKDISAINAMYPEDGG